MIYIWLVILSLAIIYLFHIVYVLLQAVEQIQNNIIDELQQCNTELDNSIKKLDSFFKDSE